MQIFATDLDEGALATAREGRYPRSIEADVSAERLKRFFVDEGTHYRIDRQVRDLVLFATHSVVREPPFMRLDLITCRNVLIYLERALQQHVNSIFRYGLKAEGYLFLGTAETADTSDNHFAMVDRDARIYRALPTRPEFVPILAAHGAWNAGRPALTESRLATARLDAGEVLGESHAAGLEASAPPSALVDAGQGVLHLSPTAGRFILLSAGPLSSRLPSIVRPELRLDLKLALDRAFDAQQPTITRPIVVVMEGESRRVSLYVAPLPAGEGSAPRAIVYFLDSGPGSPEGGEEPMRPPDELQHLHGELKAAQEAELAGRIRHESALQELRASNEELQSLNEEYRSTAEELETSKEELQSINEELQTVNAELKSKLGIISAAHNDLQNLTASSEIGTLFLDLDLRIRMFTPRVAELINVADADVGRPLTNFTHRLDYADIAADVRRVSRDLTPLETEVRTLDGHWFTVRIRPYRTLDGKVEGAVVTFDDNTDRKLAREALRGSEEKYRSLFETIDEGFTIIEMVRDDDGRLDFIYREMNHAFARMTGFPPTPGQRARDLMPDIEDDWLEYYDRVASSGVPEEKEGFQVDAARWYRTNATRLGSAGSQLLAVVFEDISERKRTEQLLRESESWLAAQKDAFRAAMGDVPLGRSLGILAAWVNENAADGRRCAFYMANGNGDGLRHVVGMTEEYARAVDGLATSPESLTWKLAGATGRPVITRDVLADPAWQEWTGLATDHGYRGCWSFPVETAAGKLIGSLVEYLPEPREPTARDRESAAAVTHAAAIILSRYRQNEERTRAEAALRESEELRRIALESGGMGAWKWNTRNRSVQSDDVVQSLWGVSASDQPHPVSVYADLMYPEGAAWLEAVMAKRIAPGEEFQAQVQVASEAESSRWMEFRGRAARDRPWIINGVTFDITEQRLAGQKLRESEERFQALFAASPVPSVVLAPNSPDFTVTAANDAYLAATLTTRDGLIGRRLFDVLTDDPGRPGPLGADALALSLDRVLASGRPDAMERVRYDIATADGGFEPHWWLAINAPVLDASGQVKTIIHQVTRMTELHLAEEAEREYQEQQAFLLKLSDALRPRTDPVDVQAVAMTMLVERLDVVRASYFEMEEDDDAFRLAVRVEREASPVAERMRLSELPPMLGDACRAGRSLAVGDTGGEGDPLVEPGADAASGVAAWAAVPLLRNGRLAAWIGVHSRTRRDWSAGELKTLDDAAERTWGAVERARAETALRDSERRQQLLIEGVPQLVWRAVQDGRWTWASPQWTEYTGQSESDSHGYGWLDPVHPDDRGRLKEVWAGAMTRGEYQADYRIWHAAEGRYRWFQSRATPARDEIGEIVEWLGTSTDVDDLRQLQERQEVLVAELQHRTRNLITVVRAVSQQTQREVASMEEFRDRFGDRLSALSRVQGLLSHLSAGQRVMFDELLRSELAALGAPEDKVTLDGPTGVPLRSATVQTFSLALHELATNAVKYGALAPGGGHLAVRWETTVSDNGTAWLRVDWRETGVDMTHVKDRSQGGGYGRELIERALPYQLDAKTTYEMTADGVHCTIAVPAPGTMA